MFVSEQNNWWNSPESLEVNNFGCVFLTTIIKSCKKSTKDFLNYYKISRVETIANCQSFNGKIFGEAYPEISESWIFALSAKIPEIFTQSFLEICLCTDSFWKFGETYTDTIAKDWPFQIFDFGLSFFKKLSNSKLKIKWNFNIVKFGTKNTF